MNGNMRTSRMMTADLLFAVICVMTALSAPAVAQCTGSWSIIRQSGQIRPPDLMDTGFAYIEQPSGALVYVASRFTFPNLIQAWRLDGDTWTLLATAPFPRRFEWYAAYDTTRRVLLLFGGNSGSDFWYNELWQFDGSTWSLLHDGASDAPRARRSGAAVYDKDRDRFLIFGGAVFGQPVLVGDTWEWDGLTWTQVATSGPEPRQQTRAAYDERRREVVLFGGMLLNSIDVLDTWTWDGLQWTRRATNGPFNSIWNAPGLRCMAYDARRGRVVLVRRDTSDPSNPWASRQAFEWDGQAWIAGRIMQGVNNNQGTPINYYDPGVERIRVLNHSNHWQYTGPLPNPEIDGVDYEVDVPLGSVAQFHAQIFGVGTLTYEWSRNGSPLSDGGRISGAETATLIIDPVLGEDAGEYRLSVSNQCGTGGSEPLPMSVSGTPPLTANPDPLRSGMDVTFTAEYLTSQQPAYLAYSVRGPGSVYFPPLNVTIDLLRPKQIGPVITTNINGQAQWVLHVPPIGDPVPVWFQAVQFENKTNVVETQIQP